MKLLVTIGPALVARTYTTKDGNQGTIYNVPVKFGDDYILTETFSDFEAQKKRGIVEGAIGNAKIEFGIRNWEDRDGNKHYSQTTRLESFTPIQQPKQEAQQEAAPANTAEKMEQKAEQAAVEPEAKVEGEGSDLPF
ncbi:MAG: hypothetical protein J5635_04940 [Paludibacteraceae bacterium]|nr:hypothetical protein [Paludibacteraceae bacterium]